MASRRRAQQDMDDESLRAALARYDENVGPITDTTRALYQRRLSQLQNGTKNSARRNSPAVSDGYTNLATLSSDDSDYDASSSNQRSMRRRSAASTTPARRKANAGTNTEKARRSMPEPPLTRPGLRSRTVHTSTFADEFSDTDSDGALPSRSHHFQTPQASPLSYSRAPYQPPQTPSSSQSHNSSSFLVHKFDETSRGNGYTALAEPKPRYQWVSFVLLLAATCFFMFLGAAYLGVRYPSHIGQLPSDASTQGRPRADAPFNVTLCENSREKPCINEADVPAALELAGRIQKLLGRIAGNYECGKVPYRSLTTASCLEFLRASSASPIDEASFKDSLLLLFENPAWGVKLLGPDKQPLGSYQQAAAVASLEANQAVKSYWCCLRLAVQSFFYQILMAGFVLVLFVVLYLCAVWYKARRDRWHLQVYNLAEKITAVLKEHAEQPDCREPFLAQVHVRDMLISPSQRKELSNLWQSAVAFLERNESRLRMERQQIEGESYLVWRWLGTTSPPRTKVWQGKAFESQGNVSGAPLGLSCVPAPCLKIRHMFDPDVEYEDDWPKQIENAILEKCEGNAGILHLHVDTSSREGCVYMKCANLDSAGQAYRALHGSWFDGNLITVKYLRLERYHDRFPEARFCYTPLRPSNSLRLSINSSPPHQYPPEEDTL
uniref:LEM domain-containing protein n=1 Tax=Amblyomma triste TaxID=251400 RepID=A0A023G3Q1_AMBTT